MLIFLTTIVLLCIAYLIYALRKQRQQYFARPMMTAFEQKMFARLKQTFPEYDVLAQVAFSALITNDDLKIRSKFNRKVTDFVLMDHDCQVVAIIELDDPSHLSKQQEDQQRDHMLQEAGYQICRFTTIPSQRQLKNSIK